MRMLLSENIVMYDPRVGSRLECLFYMGTGAISSPIVIGLRRSNTQYNTEFTFSMKQIYLFNCNFRGIVGVSKSTIRI